MGVHGWIFRHHLDTMTHPNTDINHALLHNHSPSDVGNLGNITANGQATIANTVRALLGQSVNLKFMGGGTDSFNGAPHTTTGIPYEIAGTATVIDQKMAFWLSEVSRALQPH